MKAQYLQLKARFDALSQRERLIVLGASLVAIAYVWWMLFADPQLQLISNAQKDVTRIDNENRTSRILVAQLQQRIDQGVNRNKELELEQLRDELAEVAEELESSTRAMIGPEKMFAFMRDLVNRDSNLKLQALKRLRVEGVMSNPVAEESTTEQPADVYRHFMEIQFSGSYLDILDYIKTLEAAEWRFLWDHIDIEAEKYPGINVTLRLSTLSMQKSWVGV